MVTLSLIVQQRQQGDSHKVTIVKLYSHLGLEDIKEPLRAFLETLKATEQAAQQVCEVQSCKAAFAAERPSEAVQGQAEVAGGGSDAGGCIR